jgi:hypothetical protein
MIGMFEAQVGHGFPSSHSAALARQANPLRCVLMMHWMASPLAVRWAQIVLVCESCFVIPSRLRSCATAAQR